MMHLLIALVASAVDLPGEELWVPPPPQQSTIETSTASPANKDAPLPKKSQALQQTKTPSNLPSEYLQSQARESTNSSLIGVPPGSIEQLGLFKSGDELSALVNHSVIAFSDERAPVVSVLTEARLRGIKFIGESRLEQNSRRIFIEFKRAIFHGREFAIKAIGVSSQGQPGLIGKYYSRELEYFTGDFLASFTAGYFDGLIPRRTNAFGELQADTSVDSAVKKGLASGSLATANRFREKLKKVPEFSEIKGPFPLQILILEAATIKK